MSRNTAAPLVLSLSCLIVACGGGPSSDDVAVSIEHQIEAGLPDTPHRDALIQYYESRGFSPAWVEAGGLSESAERAIANFCSAQADGLWPGSYATPTLVDALAGVEESSAESDSAHADQLARFDLLMTSTYLRYASDLLTGRVDPREIGAGWNAPVHEVDLLNVLSDSSGEISFDLSDRISGRHEAFGALRAALEQYRRIAREGGWPIIPEGEALEPGAVGERVALLRLRLAVTGDLSAGAATADSAQYDAHLAAAVARFQQRHGLEPDSVAGADAIAAMNVSVEERVRQIELNLERWRWIPSNLGDRYIYVNIPAFELHAFEGSREVMGMRVVVGKEYNDQATPVFSDTMQYVVFNPYWNVPESIAAEEILPAAREDPGYLERNDYEIVRSWTDERRIENPGPDALDQVERGAYRIRQRPGAGNALGQVKFMFPNEFNIYLHDTPAEHLFERAERAYSHGCIRVEDPVELAEFVFEGSDLTESEIRSRMEGSEQETVSLDDPLPVYILYWTAFVDGDAVHFRNDLYGQDAALDSALAVIRPSVGDDQACSSLRSALGMDEQ